MGVKKCPNCAEEIQEEAKYCIHCEKNIEKGFFANFEKKVKISIFIFLIMILILGAFFPQFVAKLILGNS